MYQVAHSSRQADGKDYVKLVSHFDDGLRCDEIDLTKKQIWKLFIFTFFVYKGSRRL